MSVKLRKTAAFDRVVAGIVHSAGDFAQQDGVIFQQEHFDTKNTFTIKSGYGVASKLLGFFVDGVRDIASWGVDELADGVFLDSLDCGVG